MRPSRVIATVLGSLSAAIFVGATVYAMPQNVSNLPSRFLSFLHVPLPVQASTPVFRIPQIPNTLNIKPGWTTWTNPELGIKFQLPSSVTSVQELPQGEEVFNLSPVIDQRNPRLDIKSVPFRDPNLSGCYYVLPSSPPVSRQRLQLGGKPVCLEIQEDHGAGVAGRDYLYTIRNKNSYILFDFHLEYGIHCGEPDFSCPVFNEQKTRVLFDQIVSMVTLIRGQGPAKLP
ncbi:MAG TPA: hypothetical protein VFQ60_04415 [Patescibacteria group bacterium]|nr:hypothetical protein [Patescibacteria group bacterium]